MAKLFGARQHPLTENNARELGTRYDVVLGIGETVTTRSSQCAGLASAESAQNIGENHV
jgi:hypothetical protein